MQRNILNILLLWIKGAPERENIFDMNCTCGKNMAALVSKCGGS